MITNNSRVPQPQLDDLKKKITLLHKINSTINYFENYEENVFSLIFNSGSL